MADLNQNSVTCTFVSQSSSPFNGGDWNLYVVSEYAIPNTNNVINVEIAMNIPAGNNIPVSADFSASFNSSEYLVEIEVEINTDNQITSNKLVRLDLSFTIPNNFDCHYVGYTYGLINPTGSDPRKKKKLVSANPDVYPTEMGKIEKM